MSAAPEAPCVQARLLPPRTCWLVGVSGGADSVALLHRLAGLRRVQGWRLVVAHLDHRLRGRAAAADARFVAALARRLGLPFVTARVDVAALAKREGWSTEQAAREARLRFFAEEARRRKAAGVVLAHTRDDQAETLLIRLLRGAGVEGLGAMRERQVVRGLTLVRPLLHTGRGELRDWLKAGGEGWREDASNRDPRYLRNRVRHEVLPFLEKVSGRALVGPLARTAGLLADEAAEWVERAEVALRRVETPAGELRGPALARLSVPLQRQVVQRWLVPKLGVVAYDTVERVREAAGGVGVWAFPGGWRLTSTRGRLVLLREQPEPVRPVVPLRVPGTTRSAEWGVRVECRRGRGPLPYDRQVAGGLPAAIALARVRGRVPVLVVRAWRAGDRLRPAGGAGSRKLHDLLTDLKIPRARRGAVPVLEADGAPVWFPGCRPAEGWQVARAADPAWHVRITAG